MPLGRTRRRRRSDQDGEWNETCTERRLRVAEKQAMASRPRDMVCCWFFFSNFSFLLGGYKGGRVGMEGLGNEWDGAA